MLDPLDDMDLGCLAAGQHQRRSGYGSSQPLMELDDLLFDLVVPDTRAVRQFSNGSASLSPAHGRRSGTPTNLGGTSEPMDDLLRELVPGSPSNINSQNRVRAEDGIPAIADRLARLGLPPGASTPSPSSDRREPVDDNYDVVAATIAFATSRPGERHRHAHADLAERRELLLRQAARLETAGAPSEDLRRAPVRAHYAHVRSELLAEVEALGAKLAMEVEATDQQVEVGVKEAHMEQINKSSREEVRIELSRPHHADFEEVVWEGG